MPAIMTSDKVVEIIMPKNGHIQGQVIPDVHACVMALDLAEQTKATEIRVHAPHETHPRVYTVEQIKSYLWNHPALQSMKGLGTVGPGPGRANFGTGQHIVSDLTTRTGMPIPRRIVHLMQEKQTRSQPI